MLFMLIFIKLIPFKYDAFNVVQHFKLTIFQDWKDLSMEESIIISSPLKDLSNLRIMRAPGNAEYVDAARNVDYAKDNQGPLIPLIQNGGLIDVFIDGCCLSNGKKAAQAGVGVWFNRNHPFNVWKPISGKPTNINAELQAAMMAIDVAFKHGIHNLRIHTDSMFVVNSMTKWIDSWKTNNWKTKNGKVVSNLVTIQKLSEDVKKMSKVEWVYVKGHRKQMGNTEANYLAHKGARMYKKSKEKKHSKKKHSKKKQKRSSKHKKFDKGSRYKSNDTDSNQTPIRNFVKSNEFRSHFCKADREFYRRHGEEIDKRFFLKGYGMEKNLTDSGVKKDLKDNFVMDSDFRTSMIQRVPDSDVPTEDTSSLISSLDRLIKIEEEREYIRRGNKSYEHTRPPPNASFLSIKKKVEAQNKKNDEWCAKREEYRKKYANTKSASIESKTKSKSETGSTSHSDSK